MQSWDVIIAGGGSAGLSAALSSARLGARTLLLERETKLGGMGVNALVHTFCGLFHPDVSRPWQWLNPGIPQEIGEAMMEQTGQTQPDLMGRVYVLRQHPGIFAMLADRACAAESSLTRLSGTEWSGLKRVEDGWQVDFVSRGVLKTCRAKAVVDCTGDATGARWLGREFWIQAESGRLYRPAYVCQMNGVSGSHDDGWRLQTGAMIVKGIKAGDLPEAAMAAQFRDSPFPGEMFLTIDLEAGGAGWDPFDPQKRAEAEAEGRRAALGLWRYLRRHHADFAGSPPPVFPTQAGIRETARYRGDVFVTGDQLAACTRFEDEAALAGWPMEKRETARGPRFRFFDEPRPAGIPAGCLRNAGLPGLFFAGRCLSADHEALASLRVMGTCMATGEAAGRMAADHAART